MNWERCQPKADREGASAAQAKWILRAKRVKDERGLKHYFVNKKIFLILFSRYATAPLTRGAPLLSFNADGISDIFPVLRGDYPEGEASCLLTHNNRPIGALLPLKKIGGVELLILHSDKTQAFGGEGFACEFSVFIFDNGFDVIGFELADTREIQRARNGSYHVV